MYSFIYFSEKKELKLLFVTLKSPEKHGILDNKSSTLSFSRHSNKKYFFKPQALIHFGN